MESEELGHETGYVTDSSFASRQGLLRRDEKDIAPPPPPPPQRQHKDRNRKTKSERNKTHRGSVPLLQDSESEVSDARSGTSAHVQNKQRRRGGSKQFEKENFERHQYRRGSSRRNSTHGIITTHHDEQDGNPNKPVVTRQRQHVYRRDSRINSFMAFTHHADAISEFATGAKYHLLKDCSDGPKYQLLKDAVSLPPRRPKLPSTTDESTDEIACLKAERQEIERQQQQCKHTITAAEQRHNIDFDDEDELQFHLEQLDMLPEPLHKPHPNTPTKRGCTKSSPTTPCSTLVPNPHATLRMNSKDIYTGTWNPKEKAVFNLLLKEEEKRKFKSSAKSTPVKDAPVLPIYPLSEYLKENNRKKSGKSGLLSGFKWFRNVLKRSDRKPMEPEFVFPKEPIFDFMVPTKKKGLFGIFKRKKETDYYNGIRRRAQSQTSHYDVDFLLNHRNDNRTENRQHSVHSRQSGSVATLLSVKEKFTKRTKSEDNLNGAFEFFANGTQVFQRTPQNARRKTGGKSGGNSVEDLASGGAESDHGFSAVRTDENADERFFYAEPKITSGKKATRQPLPTTKQQPRKYRQYSDSAFSEEDNLFFSDETMRSDSVFGSVPNGGSDSCFSSIANSVPSYSYMSADIHLNSSNNAHNPDFTDSPYAPHAPHKSYMTPFPSVYSPQCPPRNDNDVGTILSHQSAVSVYSSYSSENGFAPPPGLPPRTYKDNNSELGGGGRHSERRPNVCRSSYDPETSRRHHEDDLLMNSFHQRSRARHQTHNFWV